MAERGHDLAHALLKVLGEAEERRVRHALHVAAGVRAGEEELVTDGPPHDELLQRARAPEHALDPVAAVGEGPLLLEPEARRFAVVDNPAEVARLDQLGLDVIIACAAADGPLVAYPTLRNALRGQVHGGRLRQQHDEQHEDHHVHRLEGCRQRVVAARVDRRTLEDHRGDHIGGARVGHEEYHESDKPQDRDLLEQGVHDLRARLRTVAREFLAGVVLPVLEDAREEHHDADLDEEDTWTGGNFHDEVREGHAPLHVPAAEGHHPPASAGCRGADDLWRQRLLRGHTDPAL
mmetsp:Transcript_59243/g.190604  ORF Transcript_59243/g.190604 Transcript_59243/m.190604 type:complete len:292 (-) Transcript_59243:215-1090(-)